jgi:hypothetical protein
VFHAICFWLFVTFSTNRRAWATSAIVE